MNRVRVALIGFLLLILAVRVPGKFLVIDEPRQSDLIVVLAGETDRRPSRALELYRQGYGRKIILDVPAATKIYAWTQQELAQRYIETLPEMKSSGICAIHGLSTKQEARNRLRVCKIAMLAMYSW